jgi:hypothetical protein
LGIGSGDTKLSRDNIAFCIYGAELDEDSFYQQVKDVPVVIETVEWINSNDNPPNSLVDDIISELDPDEILQSLRNIRKVKEKVNIYYDRDRLTFWIGVNWKKMKAKETKGQFCKRVQAIMDSLMNPKVECEIINGIVE